MLNALSTDELQAGLAILDQSPKDHGVLEMIVCRPADEERHVVEQAQLDIVKGLIGDNWYTRGSRHTDDDLAHPDTQIAIMNSRFAQLIAQERSRWPLAGDQLFVDFDLSIDNLPVGQQLAIGTTVLEITPQPHTGCKKFVQRFGKDALLITATDEGKRLRLRGLYARVIQAGTIHTGDTISKVR
ncbi:MAG: MOSC domain-containing protein [Chloroflexi bacterium]|nr:MAG: MOSC domain-containing protein [Phototrophicales bacterium]RMF82829.1 MAG: MOSC domain-containing protein [Chloroflexota bacterium]